MRLNETIYIPFTIENAEGAPTPPGSGPDFVLVRNGLPVAGSTDVVIAGSDGVYQAAFTAGDDWADDDTFSISITATVDDVVLYKPLLAGFIRAASASAAQAANILSALGPVVAASGQGARTVTVTVTQTGEGTNAVEGARVRLTKGIESYTATTDEGGQASLFVDEGTWHYVATRIGYGSANGTLVVEGDEALNVALTALVIPPSPDPDLVTVVARPLDFELTPEATFHLTLDEPATVVINGRFQIKTVQSEISANGEAVLNVFPSSALAAAGYVDTYTLTCNQDRRLKKKIRVPDSGGNAALLPPLA